jgi:hypothetical protein
VWNKIFCTGPTRAAKAEQKSLVLARQSQRTSQGRTHFISILWIPIHLGFHSQQGLPLYSLSVCNHCNDPRDAWHPPPTTRQWPDSEGGSWNTKSFRSTRRLEQLAFEHAPKYISFPSAPDPIVLSCLDVVLVVNIVVNKFVHRYFSSTSNQRFAT